MATKSITTTIRDGITVAIRISLFVVAQVETFSPNGIDVVDVVDVGLISLVTPAISSFGNVGKDGKSAKSSS